MPPTALTPLRINYVMPRPNLGGGIKSSKLIAEAMVRRGHDVRIIFPNKPMPLPPIWRVRSFAKILRHRLTLTGGLRLHHLQNSTAKLIPVSKLRLDPGDVPDADVSIASWWETMEMISSWPDSSGIKVHYIRGHEIFHREKERVRKVYHLDCPKIVNSFFLQRVMREEYGRESIVVHNGIDWDQFGANLRERNQPPTVGFMVGSARLKGAHTAFEALRLAQKGVPQLRVVCFGMDRIDRNHLLPANFVYEQHPPQPRIAEIYRSADCWIVPSVTEGLPMPGLEASACRCPIVATRCGGTDDYVRDGVNGYMVPVEDAKAMSQRVLDVIGCPSERWRQMSDASYDIAREFNWDRSAEILEEALRARLAGIKASLP